MPATAKQMRRFVVMEFGICGKAPTEFQFNNSA
jgi:hypothetical protein